MELFNRFFVSYTIIKGPDLVYIDKTMIGKIILYPSKKNIFIKQYDFVFIYDTKKVEVSESVEKFLNYTSYTHSDFQNFCLSIWEERT
jgi:hypothetical protein